MHQSHNSFKMVDTIVGLCHFHEFAEPALHNGAFHLQTDPNGRSLLPSVFCPLACATRCFEAMRSCASMRVACGHLVGVERKGKKRIRRAKKDARISLGRNGENHTGCASFISIQLRQSSVLKAFSQSTMRAISYEQKGVWSGEKSIGQPLPKMLTNEDSVACPAQLLATQDTCPVSCR